MYQFYFSHRQQYVIVSMEPNKMGEAITNGHLASTINPKKFSPDFFLPFTWMTLGSSGGLDPPFPASYTAAYVLLLNLP